jgi:hypothetical protein
VYHPKPFADLSFNPQPLEYGIYLTDKPQALGFGGVCHTGAPYLILGSHQKFNGNSIRFKVNGKIKWLAVFVFDLNFGEDLDPNEF